MNLKGRSLLTLKDFTEDEILYMLDLSAKVKNEKKEGVFKKRLLNKNVALVFEKPSTRTRCAFTVACFDEGAHPEYLGMNDIQLGHKESVADTARVLGRMFDLIQFRGFSQSTVSDLAKYSGVPVINGLTDDDHPTQILADLLTVREQFGKLKGVKFVYSGDGRNNVARALTIGAAKTGLDFVIVSPMKLAPPYDLIRECAPLSIKHGGNVTVCDDFQTAAAGADVIYTDVWVSMGEKVGVEERINLLSPYRVTMDIMSKANKNAVFMHCLPAVKGNEVTEEVFESPQSIVFDQAENRMHTIKAAMIALMTDGE